MILFFSCCSRFYYHCVSAFQIRCVDFSVFFVCSLFEASDNFLLILPIPLCFGHLHTSFAGNYDAWWCLKRFKPNNNNPYRTRLVRRAMIVSEMHFRTFVLCRKWNSANPIVGQCHSVSVCARGQNESQFNLLSAQCAPFDCSSQIHKWSFASRIHTKEKYAMKCVWRKIENEQMCICVCIRLGQWWWMLCVVWVHVMVIRASIVDREFTVHKKDHHCVTGRMCGHNCLEVLCILAWARFSFISLMVSTSWSLLLSAFVGALFLLLLVFFNLLRRKSNLRIFLAFVCGMRFGDRDQRPTK